MSSTTNNCYQAPSPSPAVGTLAPDFRLQYRPGQTLTLDSLRGRPIILAFYLADWHPVCTDQLTLYQEFWPEFQRFHAVLLGVSVDSVWSHQAFAGKHRLTWPLLSDFEPKGAVAHAYGVYRRPEGTSERALFVIDRNGLIRWRYLAAACVNPGVDGILTALEKLAAQQMSAEIKFNREGDNHVLGG